MSVITRALGLVFLSCSAWVSAHGVIESPPARNWMCGAVTKPDELDFGNNTAKYPACSTAFAINPLAAYNFMAVVTHALGRASVTPLPKNVCGFDGESWKGAETPWDVPMEWMTTPMAAGPQTFTWNITWGPHFDDTEDLRFWITKSTFIFSPSKTLTWDDFEVAPFCTEKYDDKNPTANPDMTADKAKSLLTAKCILPERKGHHVIYSEWGRIGPTFERFHGCVDGAFGATGASIGPRPSSRSRNPGLAPVIEKETDALGRNGAIRSGVLLFGK
ncbi:MAG: lytic polysaccharide monooxygenase [Fibrobacteria bacterium]